MMGTEVASKIRIFAGDCVEKKKPAPDIYLLARDTFGLRYTLYHILPHNLLKSWKTT
jgi:beta-phosphoglucomutase-like phosphatase (HAD superfamily)